MGEQIERVDLEANYTNALKQYTTRHAVQRPPISQRRLDFELRRPQLIRECLAEAIGIFIYVFFGLASSAALILNSDSPALSSIFQIGLAFGIGIALAIILAGPVSGGHFNPGITLCFTIWGGFPWKKVPIFILSQTMGAFMAALLIIGCYWPQIQELKAAQIKEHGTAVYNGGAGGILCPYPAATQLNLGYYALQEFIGSAILALITWACIDLSNPVSSPKVLPFTIGLAYSIIIWGFGAQAISLNTARDLGARSVNAIFFGPTAFTQYNFAWCPTLVNLPAFVLGAGFYEYVLRDSARVIQMGLGDHETGRTGMVQHLMQSGVVNVRSEARGTEGNADGQQQKARSYGAAGNEYSSASTGGSG